MDQNDLPALFNELNARHFGAALRPVIFKLGTYGGKYAIYMPLVAIVQIDPRVIVQSAAYVSDTVLHELIHHFLAEETGGRTKVGDGDQLHAERFCAIANRIGAELGLPPVLPSSKEALGWPQSVRPPGFHVCQT